MPPRQGRAAPVSLVYIDIFFPDNLFKGFNIAHDPNLFPLIPGLDFLDDLFKFAFVQDPF